MYSKMKAVKRLVLLTSWNVEGNGTVTNCHQLGSNTNQLKSLIYWREKWNREKLSRFWN